MNEITDAHESTKTADERKYALSTAVSQEAVRGGRVEQQADFSAVIRYGKPAFSHTLHLVLTLVTLGCWSIVWLALYILHVTSQKTVTLTVDPYGRIVRNES